MRGFSPVDLWWCLAREGGDFPSNDPADDGSAKSGRLRDRALGLAGCRHGQDEGVLPRGDR